MQRCSPWFTPWSLSTTTILPREFPSKDTAGPLHCPGLLCSSSMASLGRAPPTISFLSCPSTSPLSSSTALSSVFSFPFLIFCDVWLLRICQGKCQPLPRIFLSMRLCAIHFEYLQTWDFEDFFFFFFSWSFSFSRHANVVLSS